MCKVKGKVRRALRKCLYLGSAAGINGRASKHFEKRLVNHINHLDVAAYTPPTDHWCIHGHESNFASNARATTGEFRSLEVVRNLPMVSIKRTYCLRLTQLVVKLWAHSYVF